MNTLKKVFAVTLKKYLIFRASLFWRYHLTKLKSPESPVMRKVLNQHFLKFDWQTAQNDYKYLNFKNEVSCIISKIYEFPQFVFIPQY